MSAFEAPTPDRAAKTAVQTAAYRPLAGDGELGVPGLIKIDSLRLRDLRNADQLAVRPGRQRDPDQWSRQHLSSVMGRGNEMRNRAVRTVIN